jgi:hypothetical protein
MGIECSSTSRPLADNRRADPDRSHGPPTLLDVSEPIKQILYGAIILSLAAAYARLTE